MDLVVEDATKLIKDYLGDQMSVMYRDFYSTLDRKRVVASVSEIFTEMFGKEKAGELLRLFVVKYANESGQDAN